MNLILYRYLSPASHTDPRGPGVARRASGQKAKIPGSLLFVYFAWAQVLIDPHRWIGFEKGETLLLLVLILVLFANFSQLLAEKRLGWFTPLLIYLLSQWVMVPFTTNTGLARIAFKIVLLYLLLAFVTVIFVKTLKQVLPILFIYLLQYVWWTAHGSLSGAAGWHPTLGNPDGFGPYMVLGFAYCFYFGMAVQSRKYKRIAYILVALCVLGVVTSFARGAVLSFALVIIVIWLRSPKKGSTALGIIASLVILLVAVRTLYPDGVFWTEMQTSFTDGTDKGTNQDRWELWKAGVEVFKARPLLGVGPENFGPFAASFFEYGDLGGRYVYSTRLYTRQLHNIYVQVLSEGGIVGSAAFLVVLCSFFFQNHRLRTQEYIQVWNSEVGDKLLLVPLSTGVELLMISFLATGLFYDQLYVHWFYTTVILNVVLFRLTQESLLQHGQVRTEVRHGRAHTVQTRSHAT